MMEDGDVLFVVPRSRIKLDVVIKRDYKNNIWTGEVLSYNEKDISFSKQLLLDLLKRKISKRLKILSSFIEFNVLNK